METADEVGTRIAEARSDSVEHSVEHASGLLDDALLLTHELRAALHDQLCLVSSEAQLAARSLAAIVGAAVGIGVLLVSAWLGLVAAGAFALIGIGLGPVVAMLIAAALNLIALLVPWGMIRRKRGNLGFPATLRTLRPASSRDSGGESSGERRAA